MNFDFSEVLREHRFDLVAPSSIRYVLQPVAAELSRADKNDYDRKGKGKIYKADLINHGGDNFRGD